MVHPPSLCMYHIRASTHTCISLFFVAETPDTQDPGPPRMQLSRNGDRLRDVKERIKWNLNPQLFMS